MKKILSSLLCAVVLPLCSCIAAAAPPNQTISAWASTVTNFPTLADTDLIQVATVTNDNNITPNGERFKAGTITRSNLAAAIAADLPAPSTNLWEMRAGTHVANSYAQGYGCTAIAPDSFSLGAVNACDDWYQMSFGVRAHGLTNHFGALLFNATGPAGYTLESITPMEFAVHAYGGIRLLGGATAVAQLKATNVSVYPSLIMLQVTESGTNDSTGVYVEQNPAYYVRSPFLSADHSLVFSDGDGTDTNFLGGVLQRDGEPLYTNSAGAVFPGVYKPTAYAVENFNYDPSWTATVSAIPNTNAVAETVYGGLNVQGKTTTYSLEVISTNVTDVNMAFTPEPTKTTLQLYKSATVPAVSAKDFAFKTNGTFAATALAGDGSSISNVNASTLDGIPASGFVGTNTWATNSTALQEAIDAKVSTNTWATNSTALQEAIDGKVSTNTWATNSTALQEAIDGKVSTNTWATNSTALQEAINGKASTNLVANYTAPGSLIMYDQNWRASSNFLWDGTNFTIVLPNGFTNIYSSTTSNLTIVVKTPSGNNWTNEYKTNATFNLRTPTGSGLHMAGNDLDWGTIPASGGYPSGSIRLTAPSIIDYFNASGTKMFEQNGSAAIVASNSTYRFSVSGDAGGTKHVGLEAVLSTNWGGTFKTNAMAITSGAQFNGGLGELWASNFTSTNITILSNAVPPNLTAQGAALWTDGTNLCVVLKGASGTLTTNKITVTSWP